MHSEAPAQADAPGQEVAPHVGDSLDRPVEQGTGEEAQVGLPPEWVALRAAMLEDARKEAVVDRLRARRDHLRSELSIAERELERLQDLTLNRTNVWREIDKQIAALKLIL